jgi:hypothetical protein
VSASDGRAPSKLRIWGLTGGVAAGKSTVAKLLEKEGLPVVDADQVARELYGKLASPGDREEAEIAFVNLNEAGAGLGPFMEALGDGGNPEGLGNLVEILARKGATQAQREKIFAALEAVETITDASSTRLRGLVRLMAASAFAASLLAVDAGLSGDPTELEPSDILNDPANCDTSFPACAADPACGAPTGAKFTYAPGAAENFSGTGANAIPNLDLSQNPQSTWFNGAIGAITQALNEIGAGGKFNAGLRGLTTALPLGATSDRCYRRGLEESGVLR